MPGVYSGWLDWGKGTAPAVVSVGLNPTFSDAHIPEGAQRWSVEVHILNKKEESLELYDRPVLLWFIDRLREMKRFASVLSSLSRSR